MGLALGKSVTEIKAMPYPEYRNWVAFYLMEPFGWWQEETLVARIMSMIYNTHVAKKQDAKEPKEFMRFEFVDEVIKQLTPQPRLEDLPIEERRRIVKEHFKAMFGDGTPSKVERQKRPLPKRRKP